MNTLLSIANGALQYHRGKQTGISGLIGIAFALLCVYQWKHIYPVLKALGIVDFFKRLGLVYEGEAGLTGFAIFMFIFRMTIVFCIVFLLLMALAVLLTMIFSNEKIGLYALMPLFVLMIPFSILLTLYMLIFKKDKLKENTERIKKEKQLGSPQEQILRDYSEEIPREQALARLNRLPTFGDRQFLLGVTKEDQLYILLPHPNKYDHYVHESSDLRGLPVKVEKFKKIKIPNSSYTSFNIKDPEFVINIIRENQYSSLEKKVSNEEIVSFYQTTNEDMLNKFGYSAYDHYVKETQERYFSKKKTIITNLKNTSEKDKFDNLVNLLKMFDASNEEIVQLMRDSDRIFQD